MTAYLQPASLASRKKCWTKKRPGVVILYRFGRTSLPMRKQIVDREATGVPSAANIAAISSTVVDLPLVPVTAITVMSLEGCLYQIDPIQDRTKW